jgi:hypothetical protein
VTADRDHSDAWFSFYVFFYVFFVRFVVTRALEKMARQKRAKQGSED